MMEIPGRKNPERSKNNHPKTENVLYQNQSHLVYHRF